MTTIELEGSRPPGDLQAVDEDRALEVAEPEEQDAAALAAENRELRSYLGRVLQMLEQRVADDDAVDDADAEGAMPIGVPDETPSGGLSQAVAPLRLADVERRLRRAEETIDDLLWILSRFDRVEPVSGS